MPTATKSLPRRAPASSRRANGAHPEDAVLQHVRLDWLPVRALSLDSAYNRVPKERWITQIVENFDPKLLGVWLINERKNGVSAVIDGQHRTRAMLEKEMGDVLVPCLVYEGLNIEEEAGIFRRFNEDRRRPQATDIYRAKLAEKDPQTVAIQKILNEFNLTVAMAPRANHVRSTVGLERLYLGGGPDLLRWVLEVLTVTWPEDVNAYRTELLEGLGILRVTYNDRLDPNMLYERLSVTKPNLVVNQAKQVRDVFGGGLMGVHTARTVLGMYNKGMRGGKLDEKSLPARGGRHPLSEVRYATRTH